MGLLVGRDALHHSSQLAEVANLKSLLLFCDRFIYIDR